MTVHQPTGPVARADAPPSAWKRRKSRIKHDALQAAIILVLIGILIAFAIAVRDGLARHGINFSFDYLSQSAGFDISEGKTLSFSDGWWPSLTNFVAVDTNAQAMLAGLYNTIKVALLGILLSTLLGTVLGVGRLSTNWLIRQISFWVVEFVRNTPLLIQLVFWYFAVVLQFPPIAAAAKLYGGFIISKQGTYMPWPVLADGATTPAILAAVAALILGLAAIFLKARLRYTVLSLALACLAASLMIGFPLVMDYPVATKFRAGGGVTISPEMAAILLAITFNSASYIAEIVRGGIEAVHRGQWEAAAALGLSHRNTLGDVILPQVYRVVLPSLGNQYINLAKNTALGIAIGFPELFNIYGTIANQAGRTLEGIVIVMIAYLLLSWVISATVNFANSRLVRGMSR